MYINKMLPKIVFAGVLQNASEHLPSVLKNIENISKLASEVGFIFIENDSVDSTKFDLNQWGKDQPNFHHLNLDGLNQVQYRTLRLELARNTYLEFIKVNATLKNFDFLIVIDMDDIGTYPVDISSLQNALSFLDADTSRAAVFANQQGSYYDMWALRSEKLCPTDVWEEVLDYVNAHNVSDEEAFSQTFAKRIINFDVISAPIEVESAFGGLGVYKMQFIRENLNPYLGSKIKILQSGGNELQVVRSQICEHVHFHDGIRSQGDSLFILPGLINAVLPKALFNPSFFRSLLF
jgi:hypothetical protein